MAGFPVVFTVNLLAAGMNEAGIGVSLTVNPSKAPRRQVECDESYHRHPLDT